MAFQLKSERKETETKTVRFPLSLIDRIEKAIVGKDVSFSGFVIQACEFALDNMDENEKE
ncbi:YlcI/YnfO family protein [Pseudobutyrivibrio ruminis]|uniref:YlcI/YnfO family protein n=1 Tax=Pseudobutyrivibrio ruminis TaxID=46206 RepID=UPI0004279563|nr:YlcI/YnfO family protein [Pseudobutyrivibrio ruminis]